MIIVVGMDHITIVTLYTMHSTLYSCITYHAHTIYLVSFVNERTCEGILLHCSLQLKCLHSQFQLIVHSFIICFETEQI